MEEYQSIFSEKLVKSYNMVAGNSEILELMTGLLYSVHEFSYAQLKANERSHRQAKERASYDDDDRQLMTFVNEDEDDDIIIKDKLIEQLNIYLSDKHELPKSKQLRTGVINRVKALLIMMIKSKAHNYFDQLNLPEYAKIYTEDIFDIIKKTQATILDHWIEYLTDSNNEFLIEITISKGDGFWGSSNVDPINIWTQHFDPYIAKEILGNLTNISELPMEANPGDAYTIDGVTYVWANGAGDIADGKWKKGINDYEKVYQMFCYHLSEHKKLSKNMELLKLFEIFYPEYEEKQRPNVFNRARQGFIYEFDEQIKQIEDEDEKLKLINRIIYEQ